MSKKKSSSVLILIYISILLILIFSVLYFYPSLSINYHSNFHINNNKNTENFDLYNFADKPQYIVTNSITGKFKKNKNCPTDYVSINNQHECKKSLKQLNPVYNWKGAIQSKYSPYGCIIMKNNNVYFNSYIPNDNIMNGTTKSICKNNISVCPLKCSNGCKPQRSHGPYGYLTKCRCPTTCLYGVNIL